MTIKELVDKLLRYPNQNAEISIGCNTDYGYCLRANCESEVGNVFLCDKPEYCDDYMKSDSETQKVYYALAKKHIKNSIFGVLGSKVK